MKIKNHIKHLAVSAAIFNDKNEILLTKRNEPRWSHSHGKWQFPGGGIEFGEHPEQTVIREVLEEVGVKIKLLTKNPLIQSVIFKKENVHVVLLVYPSLYKSGRINIKNDPYTAEARWFKPREIDSIFSMPEVKNVIKSSQKYLIFDI